MDISAVCRDSAQTRSSPGWAPPSAAISDQHRAAPTRTGHPAHGI